MDQSGQGARRHQVKHLRFESRPKAPYDDPIEVVETHAVIGTIVLAAKGISTRLSAAILSIQDFSVAVPAEVLVESGDVSPTAGVSFDGQVGRYSLVDAVFF